MSTGSMMGSRLRKLRRDRDMTQASLAEKLGISASYLNLIEHNRRALTVPLLLRISQILNVDPQSFAPQQEGVMASQVVEALRDPLFSALAMPDDSTRESVTQAPELAQALITVYKAYRKAQDDMQVLRERRAHDPDLSVSGHRLRTVLTSIMSFAEILRDNADLPDEKRQGFLNIIHNDSARLADTVKEVMGVLVGDDLEDRDDSIAPLELVTDFIQGHNNHFPELEDVADELRTEAGLDGASTFARLSGYLMQHHGVDVEVAGTDVHGTSFTVYDKSNRRLILSRALSPSSINFNLATFIGQISYEDVLNRLVDDPNLPSDAAREKAKTELANYIAGAAMMPYERMLNEAEHSRYDIERLQQTFNASFEQVCHRLTTLRRQGAEAIPFHMIRVDLAGNISKRFSASGLTIPRFGNACPRWVVHQAFLTPGLVRTQLSRLNDESLFFTVARTVFKPAMGYGQPKSTYSIGLGCAVHDAPRMAYADRINLDAEGAAVDVGVTCRLCERANCAQRAAPAAYTPGRGEDKPRVISPGVGEP